MKENLLLIISLLIFTSKLYSQDTSVITNVHLSEESFWSSNDPRKATSEYKPKIKVYWSYPIKYADEISIRYYDNSPVQFQNMIIGKNNMNEVIKNKFENTGNDSLLSYGTDYFELKQKWKYDENQNKLQTSTLGIKPNFVHRITFDPETFIETHHYVKHNTWIDLSETDKQQTKELQRVVLGFQTKLSDDITQKLLSNKHILGYSQYERVWIEDKKQAKEKTDRDTIMTVFKDTIITFDPETFAENINVVETNISLNSKNYQFIVLQELIFLEGGQVRSQILGLIPLRLVYDYKGKYRYSVRLPFLLYEEDALIYINKGIFRKIE